ncbi:MAG: hypothetical protein JW891_06655 [Candidatus Lokiarchaeota archaeon]|nr:hypothetical protein [Candidatus Lokiarchaeota archaeon]
MDSGNNIIWTQNAGGHDVSMVIVYNEEGFLMATRLLYNNRMLFSLDYLGPHLQNSSDNLIPGLFIGPITMIFFIGFRMFLYYYKNKKRSSV